MWQRSSLSPSRHRSIFTAASAITCGYLSFALLYLHRQVAPLQLVKNKSSAWASEQRSPPWLNGVRYVWNCSNGKENYWYGKFEWCSGHKNRPFLRFSYLPVTEWMNDEWMVYIWTYRNIASVHGANFWPCSVFQGELALITMLKLSSSSRFFCSWSCPSPVVSQL